MTHPNETLVRDLYQAFSEQDGETMQRLFDPEVVWHQPGRSVLAGDHRGVGAVFGFFGQVAELSEGTFTAELHDVVAGDVHTVAIHNGRAQAHGKTLDDHNALIMHCKDGRVTEVWEQHSDLYAVDDFWG